MRYRFGHFEFDPENDCLWRRGRRLRLAGQPSVLLKLLLDRPGAVVERVDMARLLWPPGTTLDTERGINAAIRKLRRLLGDSADAPAFIETVPRRGYRFIGDPALTADHALPSPKSVALGRFGHAILAIAGILTLLLTIALSGSDSMQIRAATTAPVCDELTVRIAVDAVDAGPTDDQLQRLAAALGDDLVGALWQIDGIRLAAWSAVPEQSTRRPDYRLQSRLLSSGGLLILESDLIEPGTNRRVSRLRADAPSDEPYLLRGQIARQVAGIFQDS